MAPKSWRRVLLVVMLVFLVACFEVWFSGLLGANIFVDPSALNATAGRELPRRDVKSIPPRCAPLADIDPDMLWNGSSPNGNPPRWHDVQLWELNGTRDRAGRKYPLSAEQFSRSFYTPDDVSRCAWARIGDRLRAGAHVSVGVLGGSMTRGTWMAYSWPDVLQAWVRHHLGNISVISE